MTLTPINLTKQEFFLLQQGKIGYGTEGTTYKYTSQEIIKIYHKAILDIITYLDSIENGIEILKRTSSSSVIDKIERLISSSYNNEYIESQLNQAIKKQHLITKTRLPQNIVYVDGNFAGCLLKRVKGKQIHKLQGLPLNIRKKITLELIEIIQELIDNNIYHLDLANSPFSKVSEILHESGEIEYVGHSHVLVDFFLHPHLIDLEGKSTIYCEKENEIYKEICLNGLNILITNFLLKIDTEELIGKDFEEENLVFLMDQIGIDEQYIGMLANQKLSLNELKTLTKTLNPTKNL